MKTKTVALLLLTFVIFSAPLTLAAFPEQNWHYYKELQVENRGFAAIKLDPEIMKNCAEFFNDLRVSDLQGREIPSQIIHPGAEEEVYNASLLNSIDYPEYSSVVIDLGPAPRPHNRIILSIVADKENSNYLREVNLQASEDNQTWGELCRGSIFSFDGGQSNQLSYPTNNMRYLRVDIMNKPGEKLIRVASAQVKFLPADLYEGNLITSKIISNRSDKTSTSIILDLGVPNYMVAAIKFETPDRNFVRRVECATSDKDSVDNQARPLASGQILSYEWNNVLSVQDQIEINQFCRQYLILTLYNGSSPPLKISGIKVYGSTPTLIADLDGASRLWYGNSKAEAPSYDLYEFANLIEKNKLPLVKPGPQQLNPAYQAPVVPWTEKNKWLLDLAIVLLATGFIYFIIRNFKRIRNEKETQS